jgi:hypothetical protein
MLAFDELQTSFYIMPVSAQLSVTWDFGYNGQQGWISK